MPEIRLSNLSTGGCISVFHYKTPLFSLSRRQGFPFFVQHRAISGIFYISFTNCSPHRPGNPVSFEHKEAASRKHPRRANSNLSNRLRFSISPLSFSLISLTETQPVNPGCVSVYLHTNARRGLRRAFCVFRSFLRRCRRSSAGDGFDVFGVHVGADLVVPDLVPLAVIRQADHGEGAVGRHGHEHLTVD